jgi:HEAT repeat protein
MLNKMPNNMTNPNSVVGDGALPDVSLPDQTEVKRVDELVINLQGSDPDVRYRAARALSDIGPEAKDAVPVLIKCLKDRSPDVRFEAALALGAIGQAAEAAIPAISECLKEDRYLRVRAMAALVLSRIN